MEDAFYFLFLEKAQMTPWLKSKDYALVGVYRDLNTAEKALKTKRKEIKPAHFYGEFVVYRYFLEHALADDVTVDKMKAQYFSRRLGRTFDFVLTKMLLC